MGTLLISKIGKYKVYIKETYLPKLDKYGFKVVETGKFFLSENRAIHHARMYLKKKRRLYVPPTPRRVRNKV